MLFSADEQALEQISGRVRLTDGAVASWVRAIRARANWCEARNARYVLMIAPDKRVVYADRLPRDQAVSAQRPAMQLMQAVAGDRGSNVVYPIAGLRARRKLAETFHLTGSGWTDYGAYTAYVELLESLRPRFEIEPLAERDLTRRTGRMVGDLALELEAHDHAAEAAAETVLHVGHAREREFARRPHDPAARPGVVEVFEADDQSLPRAVLFADRSAAALLPFLCPHFSRVVVSWSATFDAHLIEIEAPGAVLTILRESALSAGDDAALALAAELPPAAPARDVLIDFRAGGNAPGYIGHGWSGQEPEHRWTVGGASRLTVPVPLEARDHEIQLDLKPCVFPPDVARQRLAIRANGVKLAEWDVTGRATLTCALPASAVRPERALELQFDHPDFVNPSALGRNGDDRPLAFCFFTLSLRPERADAP